MDYDVRCFSRADLVADIIPVLSVSYTGSIRIPLLVLLALPMLDQLYYFFTTLIINLASLDYVKRLHIGLC